MKKLLHHHVPLLYVASGIAIILLGFGGAGYAYYLQREALTATRAEFAAATSTLEAGIRDLNDRLAAADATNSDLQTLLRARTEENAAYGAKVNALASSVAQLDKLSKTDRELLQKYSAVYFLNENFIPAPLVSINPDYLTRPDSELQIHGQVNPHLEALLKAAAANGTPLEILSAYRSFGTQAALKTNYKVSYGAGTANQFSADQGYSEHQLGSTVDFTTEKDGDNLNSFKNTTAYDWLREHGHEFGFVLSYPEGNKYFTFEPWHWRFVGVELATKLHAEGKYFYDLDQRDINQYLVKIFD